MIYSQFALFMLRVLGMVHQAAFKFYSSNNTNTGNMRTARIEGDIEIGALFPVHRKQNGSDSCGDIWEQYGIHRTEVALLTIDEINNRSLIGPKIRLGIHIRDDCWTERKAMEQSIEFIRDTMGQKPTSDQCCMGLSSSDERCPGSGLSPLQATAAGNRSLASSSSSAPASPNLAAVVGPGSSDPSIAVQNLMQVFRVPQVGYSATTVDLSDKIEFKYYMRVAPSDKFQAKAVYDIVRHFNWSYIAAVYTAVNYGEKGFHEFYKNVEKDESGQLCLAVQEKIKSLAPPEDYDNLLKTILTTVPKPQVAVCFCEGQTMREIFKSTKRIREKGGFPDVNITDYNIQWIGSDGWSDRMDVIQGVEDYARGQMSLKIYSPHPGQFFDEYFLNLKPNTNHRNPWFEDFWEEKFKCSLKESTRRSYTKVCHGNESLRDGYEPDPKLSQVINSIYTVAYALSAMYNDTCGNFTNGTLCPQMKPINGSELFQYMLRVRFEDFSGQEIYFDSNGDPPARYDIINYQGPAINYKKVGEWKRFETKQAYNASDSVEYQISLKINRSVLIWSDGRSAKNFIPPSFCAEPCRTGWIKNVQPQQRCCWKCQKCQDNEYLLNEETCHPCKRGMWPTEDRLSCFELEMEYFRYNSPEAITAAVIAVLGILATFYTTVQFLRYNSTPVVKATTRELSYIILAGFFLCYATTFLIIIKPDTVKCYFQRVVPGTAFAMIYGALLTKTNRIARILAGSKKRILTKKPRFMSTFAQLVITLLLVGVELSIITAVLIYEPPSAVHDYSIPKRNLLICKTTSLSFLAPFGFDFFLITLCTLYAVKTRNLPENFNEAKFIGFTMYTTCIIWLAFCTIYFGSNNKGMTMCLSFSLSATVGLVLLFFPKLYIIVFQPEKNVRSSYATTKVIRCHFGTSPSQQSSANQSQNNRTLSSVKTSSRVSSKYSTSRSATDSGIETSIKFKRNFLRESVHVPAGPPQKYTGASGGSGRSTKIEISQSGVSPGVAIDTSPTSSQSSALDVKDVQSGGGGGGGQQTTFNKTPSFRSPVYYHGLLLGRPTTEYENELSVIEESLLSHDDSTATQSQGPASLDQPAATYANQSCQTDADLLEDLLRVYFNERKFSTAQEKRQSFSQKTISASSLLDKRQLLTVAAQPARKSSTGANLKRTLSEYKHNLKNRLLTRSKERIERPDTEFTNPDDPFEAMLVYRLRDVQEQREDERSATPKSPRHDDEDDSPLLNPTTGEFGGGGALEKRPSKKYGKNLRTTDAEHASTDDVVFDGDEERKKKLSSSSGLNDLLAQGLGGSLQTMFGTAVPVGDDQDFFIRTEVFDYDNNENGRKGARSLIGETVESTFGTLAGSLYPGQSYHNNGDPSQQHRLSVEGAASAEHSPCGSKLDLTKSSSFFSKLGLNLRKKIRSFGGDASASSQKAHQSEQQTFPSPAAHQLPRRSFSSEHMDVDKASSSSATKVSRLSVGGAYSRAYSMEAAGGGLLGSLMIAEESETPPMTSSPVVAAVAGDGGGRCESLDETDSGIMINKTFEKNVSFDSMTTTGVKSEFDTDSSKHSSAKSKRDSLKKGSFKQTLHASTALPVVTTTTTDGSTIAVVTADSVVANTALLLIDRNDSLLLSPSNNDPDVALTTVASSGDIRELEQIFYNQGLQPKEFSQSTLV